MAGKQVDGAEVAKHSNRDNVCAFLILAPFIPKLQMGKVQR